MSHPGSSAESMDQDEAMGDPDDGYLEVLQYLFMNEDGNIDMEPKDIVTTVFDHHNYWEYIDSNSLATPNAIYVVCTARQPDDPLYDTRLIHAAEIVSSLDDIVDRTNGSVNIYGVISLQRESGEIEAEFDDIFTHGCIQDAVAEAIRAKHYSGYRHLGFVFDEYKVETLTVVPPDSFYDAADEVEEEQLCNGH